ncbi:MAG: aconitase X swivel domain-containing protein [Alphaproteobacteria bacterium]
MKADPVIPGVATGVVLRCARPLSFWGGVDPATGRITDPESEHRGEALAGRVLMLAATRGSSSSSSVLLELVAAGTAPAAIVLGEVDAILGIGILVGRELGHRGPPLLRLDASRQAEFATGDLVAVAEDGAITRVRGAGAIAAGGIVAAEDPAQLRQRVARLRGEHRDLDDAIARLSGDALHDQVSLQRLKKRKLALKDQMQRLEAMLVPDIIA